MSVILGLGCDRDTPKQSIEIAIGQALESVGLKMEEVAAAATIDKKGDEVGLLACCETYGWPLTLYRADQLAVVEVPNPSDVVMRHVGTPAVAEAAALLLTGKGQDALLVEKHKYRGEDGRNVTVSVVSRD